MTDDLAEIEALRERALRLVWEMSAEEIEAFVDSNRHSVRTALEGLTAEVAELKAMLGPNPRLQVVRETTRGTSD